MAATAGVGSGTVSESFRRVRSTTELVREQEATDRRVAQVAEAVLGSPETQEGQWDLVGGEPWYTEITESGGAVSAPWRSWSREVQEEAMIRFPLQTGSRVVPAPLTQSIHSLEQISDRERLGRSQARAARAPAYTTSIDPYWVQPLPVPQRSSGATSSSLLSPLLDDFSPEQGAGVLRPNGTTGHGRFGSLWEAFKR